MIFMRVQDNRGIVIIKAKGEVFHSPSLGILQAVKLERHLKSLGDDWLAVIRLTQIGIYQVCNS